MLRFASAILSGVLLVSTNVQAEMKEKRVAIRDGWMNRTLAQAAESNWIRALGETKRSVCKITVEGKELVVRYDVEQFPASLDESRSHLRDYVSHAAPESTAAQKRSLGLILPSDIQSSKLLVVMIHGLDTNEHEFACMSDLLAREGYQGAYFNYPNDQPIAESAALLKEHLQALRQRWPELRVAVVAHSMGGLVARSYLESSAYVGGVTHLVMLGPPNHGSKWAGYRPVLEARDHLRLWKGVSAWSPTWMITDGLGEAGRDLRPGSAFLNELNAHPRREGVKYTIVVGTQHTARRLSADVMDSAIAQLPNEKVRSKLARWSKAFRSTPDTSDGPVAIESAKLEGVSDVVLLPIDHDSLYIKNAEGALATWETIRERLKK